MVVTTVLRPTKIPNLKSMMCLTDRDLLAEITGKPREARERRKVSREKVRTVRCRSREHTNAAWASSLPERELILDSKKDVSSAEARVHRAVYNLQHNRNHRYLPEELRYLPIFGEIVNFVTFLVFFSLKTFFNDYWQ